MPKPELISSTPPLIKHFPLLYFFHSLSPLFPNSLPTLQAISDFSFSIFLQLILSLSPANPASLMPWVASIPRPLSHPDLLSIAWITAIIS